jgi:hypothetical protein
MLKPTVGCSVYLGIKHPYGAYNQIFITVSCRFVDIGNPLWRVDGSVRLQLLLALATVVILGSEPHKTHDHILLSPIRDSLSLEDQVPVFISPSNWAAQLYPQALGSSSVASYD